MPWVRGDLKILRPEGSREHPPPLETGPSSSKSRRRIRWRPAENENVPQSFKTRRRFLRRLPDSGGGVQNLTLAHRVFTVGQRVSFCLRDSDDGPRSLTVGQRVSFCVRDSDDGTSAFPFVSEILTVARRIPRRAADSYGASQRKNPARRVSRRPTEFPGGPQRMATERRRMRWSTKKGGEPEHTPTRRHQQDPIGRQDGHHSGMGAAGTSYQHYLHETRSELAFSSTGPTSRESPGPGLRPKADALGQRRSQLLRPERSRDHLQSLHGRQTSGAGSRFPPTRASSAGTRSIGGRPRPDPSLRHPENGAQGFL